MDKITDQEKLVVLMKYKQECISANSSTCPTYITEEDINDLMSFPDFEAHEIVQRIKENVMCDPSQISDADTCPFCILYLNEMCVDCPYAKRHQPCRSVKSDYSLICATTTDQVIIDLLDITELLNILQQGDNK